MVGLRHVLRAVLVRGCGQSVAPVDIQMANSSGSVPPLQGHLQSGSTQSGLFVQNGSLHKNPFH
jgi:hypothetical protein